MPIVEVEIVLLPGGSIRTGLAAEIANRCREVFSSAPGSTWVKLRAIPCDHYAEDGGGPPDGACPVFVSVLKARLPAAEVLRAEVGGLIAAVAEATGRPTENIHIVYLPAGSGRVAFGGNLVPAE